jgi:ssRNA-specific RNase YbeY (16S rRNA maturation enzyme)
MNRRNQAQREHNSVIFVGQERSKENMHLISGNYKTNVLSTKMITPKNNEYVSQAASVSSQNRIKRGSLVNSIKKFEEITKNKQNDPQLMNMGKIRPNGSNDSRGTGTGIP